MTTSRKEPVTPPRLVLEVNDVEESTPAVVESVDTPMIEEKQDSPVKD